MAKPKETAVVKKEAQKPPAIQTPNEMIRLAIEQGADLEKLEKLLDIQERWEANQAKKAYVAAMAAFKENPPKIDKDKVVSHSGMSFKHASLANVTSKINEALSQHGLSASWKTTQSDQKITVICKITHDMGHSEETSLSAPADDSGKKNTIQAIGSTITYLERYSLLALTGLATEEQDDDGEGSTEVISEKQLSELCDLLDSIDEPHSNLAKFMGVDDIENIRADEFQKAKAAVEAKILHLEKKKEAQS